MKKCKTKTIIRICIVLMMILIGVLTTYQIHRTLIRKASWNRMLNFLENGTNEDVLFIGNSTIMDGVIPMELWKQYGITSYTLCSEYNDMEREPMMLRMAMQYCKPSLVVLNVDNYWGKSEPEDILVGYHEFVDAFPLTKTKIDTVCELYPDAESRLELLMPLYIYHDRWKDLGSNDFRTWNQSRLFKGYEFTIDQSEIHPADPIDPSEANLLKEAYGIQAIRDITALCKENGIDVLLISLPYEANTEELQLTAGLHELADELDVPYINFFENMELFDTNADFKDINHLNLYGAEKATAFLGDYFSERYQLPDHRNDAAFAVWNENYEDYLEYKEDALNEE